MYDNHTVDYGATGLNMIQEKLTLNAPNPATIKKPDPPASKMGLLADKSRASQSQKPGLKIPLFGKSKASPVPSLNF